MKKRRFFYTILLFCLFPIFCDAQDMLSCDAEFYTVVGTGDYTPFLITSNTYGKVPLEPNSLYAQVASFLEHSFSRDFSLRAGIDVTTATRQYSSVWLQQIYADLNYKRLRLSLGQKEDYRSMLDRNLSIGDFTCSANARPIPGISLSIPEFTAVPFTHNSLKFKGDFFVGKSLDNNYIRDTKQESAPYSLDILWHYKSFWLLLENESQSPFYILLGIDHAAQWGGWTTFMGYGDVPQSSKDFVRIVFGREGGSDSHEGDQINVLGNHLGTYNLKFGYKGDRFRLAAYKQHFFDDKSGMDFVNWRDGNWGLEVELPRFSYIEKVVLEYFQTTNQSGPMHFLEYDIPGGRGGGYDDYYNHDYYFSGWSYFGRSIGNPLLTSPAYNRDNALFFKNTRVKAVNLGFMGSVNSSIDYRLLFVGTQSWGRMTAPFLKRKDDFLSLLECSYTPPRYKDWSLSCQLSLDIGDTYGNNLGFSFKVRRKIFKKDE